MTLYHYCCSCRARQITARGFLQPHGRAQFGVDLVWLTDRAIPDRASLGLTSHTLTCDRLDCQYVADVEPGDVQAWLTSDVRARFGSATLAGGFEGFERGRDPASWWISTRRVYVVRNRAYRLPAVDHVSGSRVVVTLT